MMKNKKEENEKMRDRELSRKEKIEQIKEINNIKIENYEREYFWKTFRNWAGGAIIIGTSVVPLTTVLKAAQIASKVSPAIAKMTPAITKIVVSNIKMTKPIVQQIVTNAIKRTATEGAYTGTMYGIGISIQDAENLKEIIEKMTNSIITAMILSVTMGTSGSFLSTKIGRGKEIIETFGKRKDWGIAYRKAMGNPKLALETLLKNQQGFVPRVIKKRGIGYIDFPWGEHKFVNDKWNGYGIKHINEGRSSQKNMDMNKFWKNFLDTLENTEAKSDPRFSNDMLIEDLKTRIAIGMKSHGKKMIFPITAYPVKKKVAKRLAAWRPKSKPYVSSRNEFTTKLDYNAILPNYPQIINPQVVKSTGKSLIQAITILLLDLVGIIIEEEKNPQRENNYEYIPNEEIQAQPQQFYEYFEEEDETQPATNVQGEQGHWVTINGNHVFIKD